VLENSASTSSSSRSASLRSARSPARTIASIAARRALSANTVVEKRVSSMSNRIASSSLLTARPGAPAIPGARSLPFDFADVGDARGHRDHQAPVLVGLALLLEQARKRRN